MWSNQCDKLRGNEHRSTNCTNYFMIVMPVMD